jgi:hypothetical protein
LLYKLVSDIDSAENSHKTTNFAKTDLKPHKHQSKAIVEPTNLELKKLQYEAFFCGLLTA